MCKRDLVVGTCWPSIFYNIMDMDYDEIIAVTAVCSLFLQFVSVGLEVYGFFKANFHHRPQAWPVAPQESSSHTSPIEGTGNPNSGAFHAPQPDQRDHGVHLVCENVPGSFVSIFCSRESEDNMTGTPAANERSLGLGDEPHVESECPQAAGTSPTQGSTPAVRPASATGSSDDPRGSQGARSSPSATTFPGEELEGAGKGHPRWINPLGSLDEHCRPTDANDRGKPIPQSPSPRCRPHSAPSLSLECVAFSRASFSLSGNKTTATSTVYDKINGPAESSSDRPREEALIDSDSSSSIA